MAQDARALLEQYTSIQKFYHGDYYPVTPYSQNNDVWVAWQFDLPEDGEGLVQAFRREKSTNESARLNLRELDPDARYTVKNMDSHGSDEITGRELMEEGLDVHIEDCPGAAIITYKKIR
jgi:alpha-galactosidase